MSRVERIPMDVAASRIAPHPLNDNVMSPERKAKLRANLERNGGATERLILRELDPTSGDFQPNRPSPQYQIMSGHQRFSVLCDMGVEMIPSEVWFPIDDATALQIVATFNIKGEPDPDRRAILLRELNAVADIDIATILPEDEMQVAAYLDREVAALEPVAAALAAEEASMGQVVVPSPEAPTKPASEPTTTKLKPGESRQPDDEFVKLPYMVPKAVADSLDDMVEEWSKGMIGRNRSGRVIEFLFAEALATYGMATPDLLKPQGE